MLDMFEITAFFSKVNSGAITGNTSLVGKASLKKRIPMLNIRTRFLFTAFSIFVIFAHPCLIQAESYLVTGEIDVEETYDDNVDYDDITDLVTNIRPSIDIQGGTQRTSWNLQGSLEHKAHYNEDDKDRTNRSAAFSVTRAFSPRWNASLNTSVALDHTIEQSIEEFAIVVAPSKRLSTTISPSTTFYIDSINAIQLSGELERQHAESESIADQNNKSINLTWSRQLNEVSSLIATGSYSKNISELENRTTTQNVRRISMGYERQWMENLSSSFSIGPSFSSTTIDFDPGPELEEDQRSYYIDGSITWDREKSAYTLSVNRQQTQSTLGEPSTRIVMSASMRYSWTERLNSTLNMSYSNSERGEDNASETEYYRISPSLRYRLAENLYMRLNYSHALRRDITADTSETRNQVSLSLSKSISKLID